MKIALIILLISIAFFVTDCSAGRTAFSESRVTDHQYKPSHTDIWTSTDGHDVQVHTIYYPEEWHVYCESLAGNEFDIQTSHRQYAALTNGQPVFVRYRQGRWTHFKYLSSIEPINRLEK